MRVMAESCELTAYCLLYMKARYYDPNTGRLISEDPIGFEGGDVNLYNYAGGNPVNLIDPWGLFAEEVITGLAACLSNDGCRNALATGLALTSAAMGTAISTLINEHAKDKCDDDDDPAAAGRYRKTEVEKISALSAA